MWMCVWQCLWRCYASQLGLVFSATWRPHLQDHSHHHQHRHYSFGKSSRRTSSTSKHHRKSHSESHAPNNSGDHKELDTVHSATGEGNPVLLFSLVSHYKIVSWLTVFATLLGNFLIYVRVGVKFCSTRFWRRWTAVGGNWYIWVERLRFRLAFRSLFERVNLLSRLHY